MKMEEDKTFDQFDQLRVELNEKLKVIFELGRNDVWKESNAKEMLIALIELMREAVSSADIVVDELLRIKVEIIEGVVKTEDMNNITKESMEHAVGENVEVSTEITSSEDVKEEHENLSTEKIFFVKKESGSLPTVNTIHGDKREDAPYHCEICEKSFLVEIDLKRHCKKSHTKRPYSCDLCERSYLKSHSLSIHKRTHTGEKPFSCEACSKSFKVKCELKKHEAAVHSGKKFSCHICPEFFDKYFTLTKHLKTHRGERPYTCEICKMSFKKSQPLKRHQMIHTGERPFRCDICGKGFTLKVNLEIHIRVHTREKPYSCEVCGQTSSTKSSLNLHFKRFHTGVKPFKCNLCGKAFILKARLEDHLRVHTGEKPYSCEECGHSFTTSNLLRRHMRKPHIVNKAKNNHSSKDACEDREGAKVEEEKIKQFVITFKSL